MLKTRMRGSVIYPMHCPQLHNVSQPLELRRVNYWPTVAWNHERSIELVLRCMRSHPLNKQATKSDSMSGEPFIHQQVIPLLCHVDEARILRVISHSRHVWRIPLASRAPKPSHFLPNCNIRLLTPKNDKMAEVWQLIFSQINLYFDFLNMSHQPFCGDSP